MELLALTAQVLTAIGILLAVHRLKADHDRERRQLATKLIWEWTLNSRRNTNVTIKLINELGKEECKAIFNQEELKIHKRYEALIMAALLDSGSVEAPILEGDFFKLDVSNSSYLRSTVTRHLNLLESIFLAWQHSVADKAIIEQEFKFIVQRTPGTTVLKDYMEVAGGQTNYPAIFEYLEYLRKNKGSTGTLRNPSG